MEQLFPREELQIPQEHHITNQLKEVVMIEVIMTLLTNGFRIQTDKRKVRMMDILIQYANTDLNMFHKIIKQKYKNIKTLKGLTRLLTQLRWLNIAKRTWLGLSMDYEENDDYEVYSFMYDNNHKGDISALMAAAEIIIDENELGFYAYYASNNDIEKHRLVTNIVNYLRAMLLTSEIFVQRYREGQFEPSSSNRNWSTNKQSDLINRPKGEYHVLLMYSENIKHYAVKCNSYRTIEACKRVNKVIDAIVIEHLPFNIAADYIEYLYNSEVTTHKYVTRTFESCYYRHKIICNIRVIVREHIIYIDELNYHIYCDEWLKSKIIEDTPDLVFLHKLKNSFEIIAGDEHEYLNDYQSVRKQKCKDRGT